MQMEDKYKAVRELPFDVVARALGIDISRFKPRKGGTEWSGPCPLHQAKRNNTAFSYAQDGKFNCFSCGQKGRGAIDLYLKMRGGGFQEAVSFLEPYARTASLVAQAKKPELKQVIYDSTAESKITDAQPAGIVDRPTENKPFKGSYEKFYKPHQWFAARGLAQDTL